MLHIFYVIFLRFLFYFVMMLIIILYSQSFDFNVHHQYFYMTTLFKMLSFFILMSFLVDWSLVVLVRVQLQGIQWQRSESTPASFSRKKIIMYLIVYEIIRKAVETDSRLILQEQFLGHSPELGHLGSFSLDYNQEAFNFRVIL